MVVNFKIFKKASPNNMVTLYMNRREFVDSVTQVEPVDGIVVLDDEYIRQNRKIFVQLICNFRYGREDDEMIGLRFQKELILVSQPVYPEQKIDIQLTKMQERLLKKLGSNAYPFILEMPPSSPASVVLQQKANDSTQPCGVQYFVKVFAGENDCDRSHRRSTVNLGIRKVQYAPTKTGIQPCTVVRKDFLLSPGELELEVTLDRQLYYHGEKISINICVRNNSNKVVKKIKAMVQQGIDVVLFQNGQFRNTIAFAESSEGCPLNPGSSLQKIMYLVPNLAANCDRAGIAVEGDVKHKNTSLASTTLIASQEARDAFGIIVSYAVKVKLFLGALGGELCAELPFILMHPKPSLKAQPEAETEEA
ncbi:phosrestin-2 [Calliphora vicina]|uniref:Phosrestin-2 n=1 Tax=Calliphora vicina TaxID=7373 RepID=ARR1_CALVI|nr:RecName: Full=Phosrestin-2; AltName: Full=Arrestin-1; AltName: Full=Arrestin-A; AltName: Full=Phosrestin II [Calliphora vicina]CAA55672.1 arrestin1 [Calliphora vicina]